MRLLIGIIGIVGVMAGALSADPLMVRIKDVGKVIEARDNPLLGFGLVVGLRNTGDSRNSLFTVKALTNLLKKMGIAPDQRDFSARNVAAVMVTATLPPYVKKGQTVSVIVSSLGDCSSLVGGTLLLTQLQGPDQQVVALAQGPVLVSGIAETTLRSTYLKNQTTVGNIPDGAIVEEEIPVTPVDKTHITIVLAQSDFKTASRIAKAIAAAGFEGAMAVDPGTIKVPISLSDEGSYVDLVARLQDIPVMPASSSKVVINSKTGTIVIGEMVRLMPVGLTHGNISINISGADLGSDYSSAEGQSPISVQENGGKVLYLKPDPTLSSLVQSLNDIGATPKDLIAILQALKESGALIATLEVL